MALEQKVNFGNLVIEGIAHVGTLTLAAEQGKLKKGTILTAAGKKAVTGDTPYGILAEDVDATAAVVAEVFLDGTFARETVEAATGFKLAAADVAALRDANIYVEHAIA
ncbi:MAG: hypothetical protein SOI56_06755 [Eubacteriales bacterium]|jgi:hypothetical protein